MPLKTYYLLHNIVKKENCLDLIKKFEIEGTFDIDLDSRRGRYDFVSKELTKELTHRIKNTFTLHYAFESEKTVRGLNNRWYVSKYWPICSRIKEYIDDNVKIYEENSNYTCLLYLNDNFEDGEIILEDNIIIKPKIGSVLLLRKDVLREEKACYKGFKYILKSDAIIK